MFSEKLKNIYRDPILSFIETAQIGNLYDLKKHKIFIFISETAIMKIRKVGQHTSSIKIQHLSLLCHELTRNPKYDNKV